MNSLGKVSLVIVGFGIGALVPQFQKSSLLETKESTSLPLDKTTAKVDDYWEQTSIKSTDLKKYVNEKACHENKRNFLACINSVLFATQKTNLKLNLNGSLLEISKSDKRNDDSTEKENLTPFLNIFTDGLAKSFNFEKLWETLLTSESGNQQKTLIASGINGYLSVSVDPHTYISPTDFFKNVSSNNERSKYFLGLSFEKRNSNIIIKKVFKNSDADLSGLNADDQVTAINGQSLEGLNLSDVSDLLRDINQKSFSFSVIRNNSNFIKKLNRTYRVLSQVQSEVIDNGQKFGYIQLSKFAYNICDNVKNEIIKMRPSSLSGLVLDLRDNPGGLLSEAACLAGLFIGENKKIFSIKYLEQSSQEVALTTSEQIYFGPVAILTNSTSASASELIAGALQEYKRATIIGETTFGKGTFQEIENWNSSNEISLFQTKGFYLLPSGKSTQAYGVTPDIVISSSHNKFNEFSNYMFPLELDKSIKNSATSFSLNNSISRCAHASENHLSSDKFIATAQKVLGCEFSTSAANSREFKNINL